MEGVGEVEEVEGVEGATAGQRETKTRGRVAGCMEMLAGRSADDSSRAF